MRSGDLAKLFGCSLTTIQNWCHEFDDYLIPSKSKHRVYTEADVLTLATVAKLSTDGLNYSAIRERLKEGYRVDNPSEANFGVDTRMIPAAAVEQIVDSTGLRVELEAVKNERDLLAASVNELKQELSRMRQNYDTKEAERNQKIDTLQEQIRQLERDLGRAETEARLLRERLEEQKGQKRRRWFGG